MSLDISLVVFVDTGAIDGPVECEIYTCNYTHNVVPMWKVASLYRASEMSDFGMQVILDTLFLS